MDHCLLVVFFLKLKRFPQSKLKLCVCSAHLCEGINFVPYSPMFLRPAGGKMGVKRVCQGGCPLGLLNDELYPPIMDADGP